MPDELQPAGSTPEPEVAESAAEAPAAKKAAARKTTAKKAAAKKAPAKKATVRSTTKKAAKKMVAAEVEGPEALGDPASTETTETTAATGSPADEGTAEAPAKKTAKKVAARKTAVKKTTAKKTTTRKTAAKKAASSDEPADAPLLEEPVDATLEDDAADAPSAPMVLFQAPEPTRKAPGRRTRKSAARPAEEPAEEPAAEQSTTQVPSAEEPSAEAGTEAAATQAAEGAESAAPKPAKKAKAAKKTKSPKADAGEPAEQAGAQVDDSADEQETEQHDDQHDDQGDGEGGGGRRRRRRGGRRRRKSSDNDSNTQGDRDQGEAAGAEDEASGATGGEDGSGEQGESGEGTSRRRRRRRRSGDDSGDANDDPQNTVTKVRRQRSAEDEITAVSGSTRLEAKKQRRREGREAGRRRAPIVSEAEFLARRESVDRVMVIRQRDELTQIGVLEDKVLVEHYVARESQTSLIGNVYLGRVQNVLPSMEAAFIDIGKGRNAVLYAGEVNWSSLGHREGQPRKIESVLTSGQSVLVQVTKDPIGHKGARLTSQVSLAGRFLVYVPDGTTSGISRKLPDTERNRLKALLKEIVPDSAGVIVRTAAEGASEEELTHDVERLKARWEDIEKNAKSGNGPKLLYGEPDLTLKVVRDLFTEDFSKLVIQGDDAWDTVQNYVAHVAPDLEERLERYVVGEDGKDIFATYRIEEQIAKGLDRKVWLPSGGSLIIDRTEAMTVVDVNTGKFTGSGGNLEETVTKNNLEAAEEIVRQLRLRDIGGIIVVDFIDMVLESNRDLVLRRLVECLGRDRTRHQVAEVTSLGLVQMTRKRIGTGLLESFSENCEHCHGRGVVIQDTPVDPNRSEDDSRRGRRSRGGRNRGQDGDNGQRKDQQAADHTHEHRAPSPKDVAAMAKEHGPVEGEAAIPREEVVPGPVDGKGRAEEPARTTEASRTTELGHPVEEPTKTAGAAEPTAPTGPSVPAEAAEPARPKVVTRTRTRRAASRPAGQPDQAAPEPVVVETPTAEPSVQPVVSATEAPITGTTAAQPAAAEAPSAVPPVAEPPRVVTRTRGRRASRPAGPPQSDPGTSSVSVGSIGAPPQHGQVEPGTADAEPGLGGVSGDGVAADGASVEDAHPVGHVPIKKKGSRKR